MEEIILLVLMFVVLYLLLLILNYKIFSGYPSRATEIAFGGSILEKRGPIWFVIVKFLGFIILLLAFLTLIFFTPIPTCYSYLFLGILLGVVFFNLYHDYLEYRRARKGKQS